MRGAEALAFLGLATGLHLAAFAVVAPPPGGPVAGAGAGGAATVTLAGASPATQALADRWRQPPEAAVRPSRAPRVPLPEEIAALPGPETALAARRHRPERPAPDAPAAAPPAPARPQFPPLARPQPASTAPRLAAGPGLPDAAAEPPVPDERAGRRAARPAPLPVAAVAPDALPPGPPEAPARSLRPAARPETLPGPAAARRAAAPASAPAPAPAPASVARGQGGGQTARTATREAATQALSPGTRRSLLADWGGRIRARIEAARVLRPGRRGRAVAEIIVTGSGDLAGVRIFEPSGLPDVDAAAVQAVRRAGRFPAAPDALGPGPFVFRLPIRFEG